MPSYEAQNSITGGWMDKAALIKLGHWLDFELNKKSIESCHLLYLAVLLSFLNSHHHHLHSNHTSEQHLSWRKPWKLVRDH